MPSIRRFFRGALSVFLFGVFGLGSLVLGPIVLILGRIERSHPLVRASWKLIVGLFIRFGLISVARGSLPNCQGTILVANHPSLIDVVLLTVLVPRTLSVAKRAVGTNPVMGFVSRSVSVPVGAESFECLSDLLAAGWNVLIFPEGTRSPYRKDEVHAGGSPALHPFQRGAAHLALRTGAPLLCVGVRTSRRILAKRQSIWDLGDRTVRYCFASDAPVREVVRSGESNHAAAVRVTAELEKRVKGLLA